MEVLQSPPQSSTFIPLAQHQSQTPASFYDIPPVLHYHASQCRLVAPARELRKLPGLKHGAGEGAGQEEEEGKDVVVEGVDVWVTSERFYFFFASSSSGLAVPYPSISLHAVQRLSLPDSNEQVPGLYMQLILNTNHNATDADDDDEMLDESDTVVMTIIPPSTPAPSEPSEDDQPSEPPIQTLYAAVSSCSDLHPDPKQDEADDDERGVETGEVPFPIYIPPELQQAQQSQPQAAQGQGDLGGSHLYQAGLVQPGSGGGSELPPAMPGSGGWITAENAHEFFDQEGNWRVGENGRLGPGAGRVRAMEEGGEKEGEGEEAKWRRTEE